jgi:hypothetical protein
MDSSKPGTSDNSENTQTTKHNWFHGNILVVYPIQNNTSSRENNDHKIKNIPSEMKKKVQKVQILELLAIVQREMYVGVLSNIL